MSPTLVPALIFDLDGTLADTAPDLLGATNAVLAARGGPCWTWPTCATWWGSAPAP